LLGGFGLVAAAVPAAPALAYETYKDEVAGWQMTYPTGYQKSPNPAYTFLVRDIIEPLESIGVKVTKTDRKSLDEIGTPDVVGKALIEDAVPKGAPKEVIAAESKFDKSGRRYDIIEYRYQWKFSPEQAAQAGKSRYQLHLKALVTVNKKKQYLVIVATEEDKWEKQKDDLDTAIQTFKLLLE